MVRSLSFRVWLFSCALALTAAAVSADSPGKRDPVLAEHVQADVRQMMTASYAADPKAVMRYTHPAIIESMGGDAPAREQLGKALAKMKKLKLSVKSLEFPAEPRFVPGNGRLFAVIPTKIVVEAGGQRAQVESFQMGVLEDGQSAWTYVEGAKFDSEFRVKLFPDFPSDYELPSVTRLAL